MGRIGSGVRVSVSFRQKYPPGSVLRCPTAAENGVMTKRVVSGGFDLRFWGITSSPSQTVRRRLVRRTATDAAVSARLDACRRPSRLYFLHFATRTVYNTRPVCSVCSYIRSESRLSEYRHPVWYGKTRMAWLHDGEKISKISLFVLANHERDGQTDTA